MENLVTLTIESSLSDFILIDQVPVQIRTIVALLEYHVYVGLALSRGRLNGIIVACDGQKGPRAALIISFDIDDAPRRLPDMAKLALFYLAFLFQIEGKHFVQSKDDADDKAFVEWVAGLSMVSQLIYIFLHEASPISLL